MMFGLERLLALPIRCGAVFEAESLFCRPNVACIRLVFLVLRPPLVNTFTAAPSVQAFARTRPIAPDRACLMGQPELPEGSPRRGRDSPKESAGRSGKR